MDRSRYYLAAAVLTACISAARADVVALDPGTAPLDATNIGTNVDRGDAFDALSNFSISSAGIFFDPLAGGATDISVNIFAVTPGLGSDPGTVGSLLRTASASVIDGGAAFYDIPVSFDFESGQRYYVAFVSNDPGGWGFGLNNMRFFNFDAGTNSPFTVGSVKVIDGGCFPSSTCSGFANNILPDIRLNTTTPQVPSAVPEPSAVLPALLGCGILFAASRRKSARSK